MLHELHKQLDDAKNKHAALNAAYTEARKAKEKANKLVRETCGPASDAANLVVALQAAVDRLPA